MHGAQLEFKAAWLDMQSLWRAACLAAFTDADLAANIHICKTQHK
jgi:hypothetical protein